MLALLMLRTRELNFFQLLRFQLIGFMVPVLYYAFIMLRVESFMN